MGENGKSAGRIENARTGIECSWKKYKFNRNRRKQEEQMYLLHCEKHIKVLKDVIEGRTKENICGRIRVDMFDESVFVLYDDHNSRLSRN